MHWRDYIEEYPEIMLGKPVFKGTRITVETVLQRLEDGWSEKDLFNAFPRLTHEHLTAASQRRFENALKLIPVVPPIPGDEIT
jgi:uncharacterized protein (DUF433 family)